MKHLFYFVVCGLAAASTREVRAQSPQAHHHLAFVEVDAQSGQAVPQPNGVIEPGEGALVQLSVSFVPRVGEAAVLPGGVGATMHALAYAQCDLAVVSIGGGSNAGTWSMVELAPGWGTVIGSVSPSGNHIGSIRPMQPPEDADQRNPVPSIWRGVWVPTDYSTRTVQLMTQTPGLLGPMASGTHWAVSKPPPEYTGLIVFTEIAYVDVPISSGPICYANCDQSTDPPVLNVADFSCFITRFAAGDPYANCDGSTIAPILNVGDFSCFLTRFAAGCE
jgi:hypothetical protein